MTDSNPRLERAEYLLEQIGRNLIGVGLEYEEHGSEADKTLVHNMLHLLTAIRYVLEELRHEQKRNP